MCHFSCPLTFIMFQESFPQEFAVVSSFAEADRVCREDSLVMVCVNQTKRLVMARCSLRGCGRKAQKMKCRGMFDGLNTAQCPHLKGTWQFFNSNFPAFKIGAVCVTPPICLTLGLTKHFLCRDRDRTVLCIHSSV